MTIYNHKYDFYLVSKEEHFKFLLNRIYKKFKEKFDISSINFVEKFPE